MRHIFLTPATAELQEAIEFYDSRQPGLGQDFSEEVRSAIDKILQSPRAWKRISEDIRRFRLRRFPYSLIYHIQPDLIIILAVMHVRRHPAYWRNRLKVRPSEL